MDGLRSEQRNKRTNRQTEGQMKRRKNRWKNGQVIRQTDGGTHILGEGKKCDKQMNVYLEKEGTHTHTHVKVFS